MRNLYPWLDASRYEGRDLLKSVDVCAGVVSPRVRSDIFTGVIIIYQCQSLPKGL